MADPSKPAGIATKDLPRQGDERRRTQRAALLVAMGASFLTPFMGASINVAIPSIGRELGFNAVSLGWIASANLLAAAVFLLPLGRWADIYGRKRGILMGLALFGFASAFCALAGSEAALISFRVLQGMGAAMIFGTSMAILGSVFPPGERGRAFGLAVAAVYAGLTLGPPIGGLLTDQLGWRWVFWVNVPIALLLVPLAWRRLRGEWADARGEPFDLRGSILYGLALTLLMLGLSRLPGSSGAVLLAAGLLGLALFLFWERRISHPLLDVRLFAENRVFAFSNLAALLHYSASYANGFLLSLYLQYLHDYSAKAAGLILLAQPTVMALFSPLAGHLSDRHEPRLVASTGMALTTAALAAFCFLAEDTHIGFVIANLLLLGFGFALFSSPNTNAIMSAVDRRFLGVASGMVGTMRLTGQMLSMGIVMGLLATHVGEQAIGPEQHAALLGATRLSFAIFAALCLGGVSASLARGKMH